MKKRNKITSWAPWWKIYLVRPIIKLITPKIKKGDMIKCIGVGYPHWKGLTFKCTLVFPNNTIGIKDSVRVSAKDFYPIK